MNSNGFSLLEVLIALFLLSISMMLFNNLILNNLQFIKAAYFKDLAVNKLAELAWEKQRQVDLTSVDDSLLPYSNLEVYHDTLQLSWQSPITDWHCTSVVMKSRGCIQ